MKIIKQNNQEKTMTITVPMALSFLLSLMVGNFAYQLFSGRRDWYVAVEHSYCQAIAIAGVMFIGWLK